MVCFSERHPKCSTIISDSWFETVIRSRDGSFKGAVIFLLKEKTGPNMFTTCNQSRNISKVFLIQVFLPIFFVLAYINVYDNPKDDLCMQ